MLTVLHFSSHQSTFIFLRKCHHEIWPCKLLLSCNALHDSCSSWEWLGVLAGEGMDMVESAFYDHVGVVQKGWNMFQPPVSTESTAVHAAFCRVGVSISLALNI